MTFLTRHRTICAVIQEIRQMAEHNGDVYMIKLCDEAREYAQSMSAKLVEYRNKERAQ